MATPAADEAAVTHDYSGRNRYWGHDYAITQIMGGGRTIYMMGWGHGLKPGHFVVLDNESTTTRYRIRSVIYLNDPNDMWSVAAEFSPRPQQTNE